MVLLVGSLLATAVLVWSALGRPALPDAGVVTADVPAADVGEDPQDPQDPAGSEGSTAGEADHPDAEPGDRGEVTVHVAGAVVSPGVVTLPAGSRIADAIAAVGGLLDDADPARVNLARPLVDGEQVLVLREGEEPPPTAAGGPSAGGEAAGSPAGPIDLNTATVAQLQTLPGIGPTLAQRIVSHREQHGPFRAPGDLRDVSGIGEKRFQDLAGLITVG